MRQARRRLMSIAVVVATLSIVLPQSARGAVGEIRTMFADPTFAVVGKMASDRHGNVYITQPALNRVVKLTPNGQLLPFAGTGEAGLSGDLGPAILAQLNFPAGVAVGHDGSVYIADTSNDRIRKVNPLGIITTFAGTERATIGGEVDYGDGGPATQAKLRMPHDVAVGPFGDIYIADSELNRIRRVDATGTITTFAGTGNVYSPLGDGGPATAADVEFPKGIDVDRHGVVYVLTVDSHGDGTGQRLRRIGLNGVITTVAGGVEHNGTSADPVDGLPSNQVWISSSHDVDVDNDGSIYFVDDYNVRRVTDGTMFQFAGNGTADFYPDGVYPAKETSVLGNGLAFVPQGLALSESERIRVVEMVREQADLAALASVPFPLSIQGYQPTFTIGARNVAGSVATRSRAVLRLPDGVSFVGGTGCGLGGRTVVCDLGDIAEGASATRQVKLRMNTPGVKRFDLVVSSDLTDPNALNDASQMVVFVLPNVVKVDGVWHLVRLVDPASLPLGAFPATLTPITDSAAAKIREWNRTVLGA